MSETKQNEHGIELIDSKQKYKFGSIFVMISVIVLIFANLDHKERKKGELSAYSIFNDGCQRLLGDGGQQMLNQFGIRTNDNNNDQYQDQQPQREVKVPKNIKDWMKQVSKMGNKPCYCGSEKKYKKCCYWRELRKQDEEENIRKQRHLQSMQQEVEDDDY
ncbi:SEC-C motif family protein, putative [Ichthyophthirius multifiliis]|uniref:SEC-C motif family protein, putative n=1 Tax=Ichthyophthirius multifiliis TaxID=5932 RepID=G0QJX3_ICHMU|nr:SEC-C motif family protein, putative [Ichthyophthirius multifiliis]EGR34481.1 SEC-C motif family protein, putative [Ichthyophthirius multifiliis]|eukprot:XP_004039785.1 SEC-C motif family protein, putative [Ichthyophthirius multifiliis]